MLDVGLRVGLPGYGWSRRITTHDVLAVLGTVQPRRCCRPLQQGHIAVLRSSCSPPEPPGLVLGKLFQKVADHMSAELAVCFEY